MKKLSKETAYNLKVGFGTLVSNQSCIEAGKVLPWWIPIILGLIATFLPVIPVMTSISKTNGETFISSTYNYSFDRDGAIANMQMKNEGIEFVVGDDHYLTYKRNDIVQNPTTPELLTSYVNPQTNQYEIRSYWLVDTLEKSINDYYNEITSQQYVIGTTNIKTDNDIEGATYYIPSYIFYYKDGNALYLAKVNSTSGANKFTGDFINVPSGTKIVERLLTVEGYSEIPADINDMDAKYIQGVYKNYKAFYNESYLDIKTKSLIYSTFMYWGIYVGLTLFLGLLIFLLTRGKRNFNNYLKWWQCLDIAGWSSFAPGVLAMILGFVLTSYAIMFYILLMGVRIMWLSMKQLSPTYQAQ